MSSTAPVPRICSPSFKGSVRIRRLGAQVMSINTVVRLRSVCCKFARSSRQDYSQSKAHRDRKHSATSHTSGYASARRESITSSMATSSMPAPSRRPSMPHRNSSTSGSVIESPLGTSYQSTHSFSQSSTYSSQSRRPSEAMLPVRPGFRSRTDSMSSNSSDYGIDGYYGFQNSTGTDGYYGWRQENGRSAPQYRKP